MKEKLVFEQNCFCDHVFYGGCMEALNILKTVNNIRTAYAMGNTADVIADTAKLIAQLCAAAAAERALKGASSLDGFGAMLSAWRLGKAISGHSSDKGITKEPFLAGLAAAEAVGFGIEWARESDWLKENFWFPTFEWVGKLYDAMNDPYLRARVWLLPRDPLALDLDGDGIETIGIGGRNTVLFDHNANGIKTGTGWLKPDDGFLVLDRNGNGKIDSGRELFGVDTVKSNGQKATDGLDALADLDSNKDGVFDA
ncbi:MAG: hypothetical protein LBU53_10590, partial [Zoogloeaceae bacterium]|nr:hypothetical protein [Zoogloeaceae bacterium]